MAKTPVNWDPNRYGSVKHVLKFDAATGTYSLQEQKQSYAGINYNFSSLPSSSTQTQTSTNTNTQQTGTTTQQQTTEAFGNVVPLYAQKDDNDPFSAEYGKGTATDANTNVVGFEVDRSKNIRQKFDQSVTDLQDAATVELNEAQIAMLNAQRGGSPSEMAAAEARLEKARANEYDMYRTGISGKPTGNFYPDAITRGQVGVKHSGTGLLSKENIKSKMIDPAVDLAQKTFLPPSLALVRAIGGEETDTQKHAKTYFTAYTSGSMAGRITGDDGNYDPANNLYHGMNRVSMYGNLEKAGQKRIDRIEKTIAKKKAKGQDTTTLEKRVQKFKNDQNDYIRDKHKDVAKAAVKKGASAHNPAEMHAASTKASNEQGSSGKSIICTQMYQQTQLEDWKKTMRLWYIFQKKYLTMEHQEGYHFLFKPFVNGMKKSKVLTALGKHCAIARTNDIKHIMFGTPFSLSGRLVRLVTEPICYITGKIKSWL